MSNHLRRIKDLRFLPELWMSRFRWSRLSSYMDRFQPGEIEFVISRYNEDVSWVRPIALFAKIYNKGPALDVDCVQLPNVGREAHTYLYHICMNYGNLAPRTVFFQARLNDRAGQALKSPARYLNDVGFTGIRRPVELPPEWRYHKEGMTPSNFAWGKFVEDVIKVDFVSKFKFVPGAYFAVSRDMIHSKPKSYYENILASGNLGTACHPEEAHYMERAWSLIFGAG